MAGLPPFALDNKFTLSQVPRPSWKPQDPQGRSDHAVKKVALDPQEIGPGNSYKLLIGGVVPRPIAFVSTRSKTGLLNLAPFSFFNVVCHDPPTVAISIAMAGGRQKDTATNILDSGEFVVNIISEWFAE
jgi:Flavin reductase like domain